MAKINLIHDIIPIIIVIVKKQIFVLHHREDGSTVGDKLFWYWNDFKDISFPVLQFRINQEIAGLFNSKIDSFLSYSCDNIHNYPDNGNSYNPFSDKVLNYSFDLLCYQINDLKQTVMFILHSLKSFASHNN